MILSRPSVIPCHGWLFALAPYQIHEAISRMSADAAGILRFASKGNYPRMLLKNAATTSFSNSRGWFPFITKEPIAESY